MAASRRISGVKELVDETAGAGGLLHVPPIYVRPPHDRPSSSLVMIDDAPPDDDHKPLIYHHDTQELPVIDLAHLAGINSATSTDKRVSERSKVIEEIGCACKEWGFFQVINHNLQPAVIQRLRVAALAFFAQNAEERMRLHNPDFPSCVNYMTSFNPQKESVRDWRDSLRFDRTIGEHNGFREAPDICKKPLLDYVEEIDVLGQTIYKAIFESLGLDEEYIDKMVPRIPNLHMAINYYPPCPQPSLTMGLSSHSDVSCLTILHPDDVPGLEIKKGGKWIPAIPIDPNALIINLSDQIEILSNGRYKSIEHRVVTNKKKARMSIACFFGPTKDTVIAPIPKFFDKENPPRYRATSFGDYFQNACSYNLLPDRATLDFVRI